MKTQNKQFNEIVDVIYSLPVAEKLELQNLLEHNIADTRRNEIYANYRISCKEHEEGKLKFSSDIDKLKKRI
ncbi:MAG: hypothetical protein ACK481_05150 [Candidatus Melainabacteria bacterium]|jgi:hypothetical protein